MQTSNGTGIDSIWGEIKFRRYSVAITRTLVLLPNKRLQAVLLSAKSICLFLVTKKSKNGIIFYCFWTRYKSSQFSILVSIVVSFLIFPNCTHFPLQMTELMLVGLLKSIVDKQPTSHANNSFYSGIYLCNYCCRYL